MARMKVLADIADSIKSRIYAFENSSPLARVAVYVKAGSRYEPNDVPGIAHYMKACAGLTTKNSSSYGITRYIENYGATFKVTCDREYLVYRIDCLRDKLPYALAFVDDTLHANEYRKWELVDVVHKKLKMDLESMRKNQEAVTNEVMHKAAYRGGLAHSKFIPEHQIKNIKKEDLIRYNQNNFVASKMTIVGLGTRQEDLSDIVGNFNFSKSSYGGVDGSTRYVGGESRIQAGFRKTKINLVVEGLPILDTKGLAALELIQNLLGGHLSNYIKYGNGSGQSLYGVLSKICPSIQQSIININYCDTGLFGFSIVCENTYASRAVKSAFKHVRSVLSGLSDKDIQLAKSITKSRALILSENSEATFNAMSHRFAVGLEPHSSNLQLIDSITLKDVQSVAARLLKSKPTLVSVGNPRYVPYIDELDA